MGHVAFSSALTHVIYTGGLQICGSEALEEVKHDDVKLGIINALMSIEVKGVD